MLLSNWCRSHNTEDINVVIRVVHVMGPLESYVKLPHRQLTELQPQDISLVEFRRERRAQIVVLVQHLIITSTQIRSSHTTESLSPSLASSAESSRPL